MACITHICPESIKTLARSEIEDSRHLLQELLGRAVSSIALPYGDFNPSVIKACELAGYENIYTTIPENIDPTLPKLVRGRVGVDPSDGPIEFFLKFNGAYGWVGLLTSFLKILISTFEKLGLARSHRRPPSIRDTVRSDQGGRSNADVSRQPCIGLRVPQLATGDIVAQK